MVLRVLAQIAELARALDLLRQLALQLLVELCDFILELLQQSRFQGSLVPEMLSELRIQSPQMERISSRQNPLVLRVRALARGGARSDDEVVLDGEHLLREALASGVRIEAAAFAEEALSGRLADVAAAVEQSGGRAVAVTPAVLAALSPVRQPSGAVAIARLARPDMEAVFNGTPAPLVFVLTDVQDPGNVGAIVRAGEACGVTGIIAAERTADAFGWKALRGSMGSTFRVPVASRVRLQDAADAAKQRGIRIAAAVPRGGDALPGVDLRPPSAILLGGEGSGLPDAIVREADVRLSIPMRPPVESLNVAVAAALIAYEAARQRAGDTRGSLR
ncbi:MAG TPA: RNA methyltransferase [Vicinamibacterales bacterium]|nr:RNA methyltransferase [Vicinamibacterales bacterium]